MKLLVVTQVVDSEDPVLGFFHGWLGEFSKCADQIMVVCLKEGKHDLPKNVQVLSLGKERGVSRLAYIFNFYKCIFYGRRNYNTVFVHMNPEYIVLGGIFWRFVGKKIVLWYTHRQVTLKLRVATFLAHSVLTAAPDSFRLKTRKVHAIGHGIDTEKFGAVFDSNKKFKEPLRIMSVGRITPIKNLDTLIEAVSLLKRDGISCEVKIIGAPVVQSDELYLESLKRNVSQFQLEREVQFLGAISPENMPAEYRRGDISVNLTPTGGIDKVVLESMAAGVIPLSSNRAFEKVFGKYAPQLIFKEQQAADLVSKIKALLARTDMVEIRIDFKKIIDADWSTGAIIGRIYAYL